MCIERTQPNIAVFLCSVLPSFLLSSLRFLSLFSLSCLLSPVYFSFSLISSFRFSFSFQFFLPPSFQSLFLSLFSFFVSFPIFPSRRTSLLRSCFAALCTIPLQEMIIRKDLVYTFVPYLSISTFSQNYLL